VASTENAAVNWIRGIRHLSSDMENLDAQGKHLLSVEIVYFVLIYTV